MKITSIRANNRKRAFEITTRRHSLTFPYMKADPVPTASDPIVGIFIDDELAREAVTYRLKSGREGFVHVEQALEYHLDPGYMRDLLLHRLTVEALDRIDSAGIAKREVIRRLGTSPAQLYRLLDPTNYRKSVDSMLALLRALDCDVDVVVRSRSA